MEVIETVEECCGHPDCVYRLILDARGTPFCNYCVMEQELRGCRISECTRFRTGIRKVEMVKDGLYYLWRIQQEDSR